MAAQNTNNTQNGSRSPSKPDSHAQATGISETYLPTEQVSTHTSFQHANPGIPTHGMPIFPAAPVSGQPVTRARSSRRATATVMRSSVFATRYLFGEAWDLLADETQLAHGSTTADGIGFQALNFINTANSIALDHLPSDFRQEWDQPAPPRDDVPLYSTTWAQALQTHADAHMVKAEPESDYDSSSDSNTAECDVYIKQEDSDDDDDSWKGLPHMPTTCTPVKQDENAAAEDAAAEEDELMSEVDEFEFGAGHIAVQEFLFASQLLPVGLDSSLFESLDAQMVVDAAVRETQSEVVNIIREAEAESEDNDDEDEDEY